MANFENKKILNFPIELYQLKRLPFYFLIICLLLTAFFSYDIFLPIPTHRGELPVFIKLIIIFFTMGMSWIFWQQIRNSKPALVIYQDKIIINQLFAQEKIIDLKNIKAMYFSHGRYPSVSFERKDSKFFEKQDRVVMQYLILNDEMLNTRQVEDILNQVFDNVKNQTNEKIYLKTIKQNFFDWY